MTETRRRHAPPWAVVTVLVLLVGFSAAFVNALVKRSAKPEKTGGCRLPPSEPVFNADKELSRVVRAYKDAMAHKQDQDPTQFKIKVLETKTQIIEFLDRLDAELESVRDPESGQLREGYSGYQRIYAKAQLCLRDLSRVSGFFD